MTLRTASFGLSGHARQTYLPGTDPALLPDPAGLYAPPRSDALSPQPFTPDGDGAEALLDGRVSATITGYGTVAERTVFDVTGPWNSVKNAAVEADGAADLAFVGFVHVDVEVGPSSEEGSVLEVVGAKRGNLLTGDGADHIDVQAASNARDWSNEFRIATGTGDDEVRLSTLDVGAAARAGDATFAAAGEAARLGAAPRLGYDGSDTAAWADLGDGDDLLSVEGAIRVQAHGGGGSDRVVLGDGSGTVEGGEGDDCVAGGRGADRLSGDAGRDTLSGGDGADTLSGGAGDDSLSGGESGGDDAVYAGLASDYEVLFSASDRTATVRDLNPADGDEGTDTLAGMEHLCFADRTVPFPALGPGEPGFVFTAWTPDAGYEVWATDGTAAGTAPVLGLGRIGEATTAYPVAFTALGDGQALFATADGANHLELWATDGTAAGTLSLRDIELGPSTQAYTYFQGMAALGDGGRGLFALGDGTAGVEIWTTDGTAAGTALVADVEPGGGDARWGAPPVPLGDGRALFTAFDDAHGTALWATDGTAAGTSLLKEVGLWYWEGYDANVFTDLTPLGDGRAVFAFHGANGAEIWVTDGTAAGTALVEDIQPGADWWSFVSVAVPFGDGRALFSAFTSTWVGGWQGANGSYGLWATDGTAAGTSLLKEIEIGISGGSPDEFAVIGDGRALFLGNAPSAGDRELWVTDGTAASTVLLKDLATDPLQPNSDPHFFTPVVGGASGVDLLA